MPVGWKVIPIGEVIRRTFGGDAEEGIPNLILMDIQENDERRRWRFADLAESSKTGNRFVQLPLNLFRHAVDRLTHAIASRAQLRSLRAARDFDGGPIGGAVIDRDRTVILEQEALFNVGRCEVEARISGAPGDALVDGISRADVVNRIVRRQEVMVVSGVQLDANLQLLEVTETANGLRLALGSGEGWKQQTRQQGDNGDNDQQFDQRKTVSGREL